MLLKRFFISMLGSLAAIWISAMLLILLGMTFAIGSIISFAGKETAEVKENSILRLDLSGVITEQQQKPDLATLLRQESMPQTLGNIVDAIAAAKNDKNIEGLYIRCNGAATGLATLWPISAHPANGPWHMPTDIHRATTTLPLLPRRSISTP